MMELASFTQHLASKKFQSPIMSDSREKLNMMLLRSTSMEELVIVDLVPCCSSAALADLPCPLSTMTDSFGSDIESNASAKDIVEQRIHTASLNVYMLAFVQFINLLFIYMWLSFSTERSQFVVVAEILLSFTPMSGILGAYFKNRVWLETFHMTSMLLYCSPLFFALAIWDVDNLSSLGYAFFLYQIMLLFYQYSALKTVLQLRRDLKLSALMHSSIIKA